MKSNDRLTTCGILPLMCAILIVAGIFASCSTTKRIPEGQQLYNGMKIKFRQDSTVAKIPSGVKSNLTKAVNVRPNNPWPFLSPYRRMPFPLGLWVYNNWSDSSKGLKGWIYNKLVEQPVLLSDIKPDTRIKMLKQLLNDNGYFSSTAQYKVIEGKNPKKASVEYTVNINQPYLLDTIEYMDRPDIPVSRFVDSMARKQRYLREGERFCVDSLEAVRVNIANAMRNKGYYFFRPEYIEFLADSLITPGKIALRVQLSNNAPSIAMLAYRTRNITTILRRRSTRRPGRPDTIPSKKGDIIVYRPQRLRPNMIPGCITFRKGKLFSVRDMDRTQSRFSRLGIFGNIQIQAVPVDTNHADPQIDVYIDCRYERPMEASIEANITSKSNSYLGPGLVLGLSNNNIFGGAERLSVNLSGSYEWQTGSDRSSVFNSYEFGLSGSLAFPRLLAPAFVRRTNRDINWTTITLSGNILNRPHYFRMAEVKAGLTYEWNHSRHVMNQLTLFRLTYTKLMRTTHDFDSIMTQNPAVALSFESQFIPVLSYTYTYDRWMERAHNNGINFTATLTEGGNVFWGLWRACGVRGRKELFGMPFSQFIKGTAQLVYTRRLKQATDNWLVTRLMIGAEHAYGNSTQVPYAEQFYIGGANSIRAFTVRSLGPGSYHVPTDNENGYFDQTGTFKFEFNTEYRFPIYSILHGAAFIDAGNIWLLKNDPLRPGGLLQGKRFLRDIALGTGVGLRLDLGMIVIRGDLGYGLHAPYDTGRNGYFNIAFKKAFAFHLAIGYPF